MTQLWKAAESVAFSASTGFARSALSRTNYHGAMLAEALKAQIEHGTQRAARQHLIAPCNRLHGAGPTCDRSTGPLALGREYHRAHGADRAGTRRDLGGEALLAGEQTQGTCPGPLVGPQPGKGYLVSLGLRGESARPIQVTSFPSTFKMNCPWRRFASRCG
jgi:hypothetical protein